MPVYQVNTSTTLSCSLAPDCFASFLAEQTVWEIQQMNPILIGTAVSEYHVIREMIKPAVQCTIGQSAVMDASFINIYENGMNTL